MSETPEKKPRRTWLIVVLAVLLVALAGTLIAVLLGVGQSPVVPSASETPSASPSVSPTASETPSPTPTSEAQAPSAELVQHFADAISSGNTAALEQNMADEVFVIEYATECCGIVGGPKAIELLAYLSNATGTWEFPPADAVLEGFRASAYAEYFPVNSVVGVSTDGFVVSFVLDPDNRVTTIFISGQPDF